MTRLDPEQLGGGPVLEMLSGAGYQAFVVGGPVRNALLGVEVSDVDIATDARPEHVMELAESAGFKAIPTGIDHGTVTVVADHNPAEVTTFRRDVEADGRRAVVTFADTIEVDAHRRDFTMNALYADATGAVHDPLGGLADLQDGKVRFIDDPNDRIREDYLRILRFFRFTAWYGKQGLDAEGLAACAELADGLDTLSRERVGAEMLKLLAAPDPAPAVASMETSGILGRILPGASAKQLPVLIHLEGIYHFSPDSLRRLSILGGKIDLRLSKSQTKQIDKLLFYREFEIPVHEVGYKFGLKTGNDIVMLRAAALEALPDPEAFEAVQLGATSVFPLRASDLTHLTGAKLGAALKEAEVRWVASKFTLTKEMLIALLH